MKDIDIQHSFVFLITDFISKFYVCVEFLYLNSLSLSFFPGRTLTGKDLHDRSQFNLLKEIQASSKNVQQARSTTNSPFLSDIFVFMFIEISFSLSVMSCGVLFK